MHELETRISMSHSPERVWALIGDFGSLRRWLPGVRDCVVEQADGRTERFVEQQDGQQVRERLLAHDDRDRWYRYCVLEAPGFQEGTEFVATLAVTPDERGSLVEWTAEFRLPDSMPEQFVELVRERASAMYNAALANLEVVLNDAD